MRLAREAGARVAGLRRQRALRDLWRLPEHPTPVAFPGNDAPLVSIVIPAFDRWPYTNACLRSIAAAHDSTIATEIVVVDDGSTDQTAELLQSCSGIRMVRLEGNGGFAAACNAGAAAARGTYLHFLNNDTIVTPGWLRALVGTLDADATAGAVVSQLRFPDDTLAEAGGVIWRDGRGSNYGRGGAPADWRYASLRSVDYGSAASLMVRADAFARAGGFSPAFAPAYYEDADLCFSLRSRGYRVVYQPRSIVYHVEGVSYESNASAAAAANQERSRLTFAKIWEAELREYFEPNPANVDQAARRLAGTKTMLVVDEHVPFTDRDAGSRRMRFLIDLLRMRGWHVIFGSLDPREYEPYASELRASGIDLIAGFDEASLRMLVSRNIAVDAVWLSRPESAARLLHAARTTLDTKIVFDTVDLHFLRLQREAAVLGKPTAWETMRERELQYARDADVTIAASDAECEILRAGGIATVGVLPVIEPAAADAPGWEPRTGAVFLGNYAHAPNVDAVEWLCAAVMPLVWERLPNLRLTLAGADPTRAVRALARNNVIVTGYVADTAALLAASRVFAAPLRFGAGVKGKIVHALAHGIPVVTTPIGAEGIFRPDEYDGVAASAQELAALIVRVHDDRALWERLAAEGRAIAERFSPAESGRQLDAALALLYAG